jgi:H2-forming N5,N10-methylenetetrahydromethanopterin dehydrogenase-like enzyme
VIEAEAGVSAMVCSTGAGAAVTVSVAAELMLPDVALMLVLPAAIPVAEPAALMVASAGTEELQVALEVRFSVLPSL